MEDDTGGMPMSRAQVIDEVRLVEIAELQRQLSRMRHIRTGQSLGRFLQPIAANQPFWAHAIVATEKTLQRARIRPELARDVLNEWNAPG